MFRGFKDFLLRGNVIDLSVAVVIGAAFTAVVTAFTDAFLKPLIQLLSPAGEQFRGTMKVDGVVFDYASFINQAITFLITAAVVYFLVVAPVKALQARRLRGEESGPAQATDVQLLTEIRDLLQDQATAPGRPVDRPAVRPAEVDPAGTAPVPPPVRLPAVPPLRPGPPTPPRDLAAAGRGPRHGRG
jgi:large conductance mechanosensitive channel